MLLHLDLETRSRVELFGSMSAGLHNYAINPSTEVLMLAWAYDQEPVELWQPHLGRMPEKLINGLEDNNQILTAFNSAFERHIFQFVLNCTLPAERFQDPQASARYLSLPGSLDEVGRILGLPAELQKDKHGSELIDIFCYPTKAKKKRNEEQEYFWRDWDSNPVEWEEFCNYCRQDVVAEREIIRRLGLLKVFPLPERERKIWIFDQRVNDRGIPVNREFVEKAYKLACREKEERIEENDKLTGLMNSNSPIQMLEWARAQGYDKNSLRKVTVESELKFNEKITPLCCQVLENRRAASSTSYTKLAAILRQISPDNRLRNQFLYMGSARCGRWSGNAVQLHNMARPAQAFEDLENVDWARAMVMAEDYDAIKIWFGSVLLTVKSLIRTVFEVAPGKRFRVSDLNAIETRVAAWVCGCAPLIKVFEDKKDPYLDFAVKMTGIQYETLAADLKSKDPAKKAAAKGHRQIAKPGVLGCVYRLSGGEIAENEYGDLMKTGLWGYAENRQVEMTRDKAHEVVRIFRESYSEIKQFWFDAEKAIIEVMEGGPRMKRTLGPNGIVEIDKISIANRYPLMRIKLPSGRYLHYMDARVEEISMPWKKKNQQTGEEEPVFKKALIYAGQNQKTKQWSVVNSHGGKMLENIVQGIARDVLAESLIRFEFELDLPICGHVHDEGISENEDDAFSPGVGTMERIMSEPIDWAPGLPLRAEGFESNFYRKG